MLGLVTVFEGLGFFKFRVVSRLGLARFAYGFVGLMVFHCLEVFPVRVYLRVSYGCARFRFFRV